MQTGDAVGAEVLVRGQRRGRDFGQARAGDARGAAFGGAGVVHQRAELLPRRLGLGGRCRGRRRDDVGEGAVAGAEDGDAGDGAAQGGWDGAAERRGGGGAWRTRASGARRSASRQQGIDPRRRDRRGDVGAGRADGAVQAARPQPGERLALGFGAGAEAGDQRFDGRVPTVVGRRRVGDLAHEPVEAARVAQFDQRFDGPQRGAGAGTRADGRSDRDREGGDEDCEGDEVALGHRGGDREAIRRVRRQRRADGCQRSSWGRSAAPRSRSARPEWRPPPSSRPTAAASAAPSPTSTQFWRARVIAV